MITFSQGINDDFMKDLKFIYDQLKNTYNLIFTTTFALSDGYTIDVPVIRGTGKDRRFDLYKEDDLYVFSAELFDVPKELKDERYFHSHPVNTQNAIIWIKEFMSGKNEF